MKIMKQKSMVLFSVMTVFSTLLIALSAYLQFQDSECNYVVDEMQVNISSLHFKQNIAFQNFYFLYTNLAIFNHTSLTFKNEGKWGIILNASGLQNYTKDFKEMPFELQQEIDSQNQEIISQKRRCDDFSFQAGIFLYQNRQFMSS